MQDDRFIIKKIFTIIIMDKFIGIILMGGVIAIIFYIFMNMDKVGNFVIPVPEKFIEYIKVKPFESNYNNSTTTPQQ